jgi:hypothetical protein
VVVESVYRFSGSIIWLNWAGHFHLGRGGLVSSFSVYQDAMKSEWPGWWVTWPLSISLSVGNVIGTEGHVLRLAGSAEDKGLTCDISEVGSSDLFKYDSNGTVSVRFKAAGTAAQGFEAIAAADAGALIKFAHSTALLVVFRNLMTLSVANVRDLAAQLLKQYWDGRWPDDLAVVTDVVSVARGAVFAAATSGGAVELRASATVTPMTLADVAGGATVVSSKNLGMEWTGTQFTPFFRVVKLRQSWIGSVKADYGPRQRGSFALPPAPVPSDLMEQAQENPSNMLEWPSTTSPIMFDES